MAKSKAEESAARSPTLENRKARHNYVILKKYEAGVVLLGSEVKALREGKLSLGESYAAFQGSELYLQKASIPEFSQSSPHFTHVPERKRKLLLHKRELVELKSAVERDGSTIVALKLYFKKGLAKIEIATAKGKKAPDKRGSIKERDEKRQMSRASKRDQRS
jgi:SsrA-binding protein